VTKNVRIENADTSDHKVRVYAEDRMPDGTWVRSTAQPHALDFPSALLQAAVWRERRLVVEELDPPAKP
jgi:hypothetical protein